MWYVITMMLCYSYHYYYYSYYHIITSSSLNVYMCVYITSGTSISTHRCLLFFFVIIVSGHQFQCLLIVFEFGNTNNTRFPKLRKRLDNVLLVWKKTNKQRTCSSIVPWNRWCNPWLFLLLFISQRISLLFQSDRGFFIIPLSEDFFTIPIRQRILFYSSLRGFVHYSSLKGFL